MPENGLRYIISHGLKHCRYAAETQSMFDEIWIKVLQEVVMSHSSAFAFVGLIWGKYLGPVSALSFAEIVGENEEGVREILSTHALAWLDIVHEDDVSDDSQLSNLATAPLSWESHQGTPPNSTAGCYPQINFSRKCTSYRVPERQ